MARFVDAIEIKTGRKRRIPEKWLQLFPRKYKQHSHYRQTTRVTEPQKENS